MPSKQFRHLILGALIVLSVVPALVRADDAGTPVETTPAQTLFREDNFRKHVEYLASEELAGRGITGSRKAGDYVKDHFESLGLKPLFENSFFQDVPGSKINGKRLSRAGRNVGAILPGSDPKLKDELIIIAAHYDHLGQNDKGYFPGADDNASGTAMLIEVARAFTQARTPPKRPIAFVAFDLEEHMLWGSRWFAAHPPRPMEQIKCILVADMIGRSLADLNLQTVFVMGGEHSPELTKTLQRVKPPQGLTEARLGIDLIGVRSDYGPFWDEHVPFLFFSTGEHPDYHQQTDVPEKVLLPQVVRVSRLIHDVAADVADADTAPTWKEDVLPSLEEVRTVQRIAQKLLSTPGQKFGATQLLLLTHVKSRSQKILDKGKITDGERTWLIRVSQIMIFSVL